MKNWNKQREDVFMDRYAQKDMEGNPIEHEPRDMWARVAHSIADGEPIAEEYLEILEDFRFVPGGRILTGAGIENLTTYFNCYVVPFESREGWGADSRQSIMETLKLAVEIVCRGGGVGLNWSVLRPKHSYVKGVNGRSSGSIGWMESSDYLFRQIEQGGSRTPALIYLLNDWHPDLMDFIEIKNDPDLIKHANLSVAISDDFMQALKADADWDFVFPDCNHSAYNTEWDGNLKKWKEKGYPIKTVKTLKARKVWSAICKAAWQTGNPGLLFIDRYNELSNTWYCDHIIGVNPCGEQGLGAWGVCNLGSINLVEHVNEHGEVQWEKLEYTISGAVEFLDDVIDKNVYINEEMEQKQKSLRRIGLGNMGLADVLLLKKLRYGSEASLEFIHELYSFIRDKAYLSSVDLAKRKGPAPAFDPVKFSKSKFVKQLPRHIQDQIAEYGIRNMALLTQAPTGTTSILAGVSSGIEPIFQWEYQRKDNTGVHVIKHPLYASYQGDKLPLPDYFVTAHDLTPEEHVLVQSVIQQYIDSSISKTVNAPNEHTVDQVEKLYRMAYQYDLKGITYFRDGATEGVLQKIIPPQKITPVDRPPVLSGSTIKSQTPLGSMLVTMNFDEFQKPFEVICHLGKNGSDVLAFTEAIGRLMSICLRSGVDIKHIIHHLKDIGSSSSIGFGPGRICSVPDAIASALIQLTEQSARPLHQTGNLCPECGNPTLIHEEGCTKCSYCSNSKC